MGVTEMSFIAGLSSACSGRRGCGVWLNPVDEPMADTFMESSSIMACASLAQSNPRLGAHGLTDDEVIYTDHGYHHCGPETEVSTSYSFGGLTDGPGTVVRVVLKSWTQPLDAGPGPVFIELSLGTAEAGTDACAELTPS